MNIDLDSRKKSKKLTLALVIVSLTIVLILAVHHYTALPQIDLSQTSLEPVQRGTLDIYLDVYGQFSSANKRIITAPASGTVAEILVRPGGRVDVDTTVLILANPELEQKLNEEKGELEQLRSEEEIIKYKQSDAKLDYKDKINELNAKVKKAKLELNINKQLYDKGVTALIEIKRAQLTLSLEQNSLAFAHEKYNQAIERQKFELKQHQIKIEQQERKVTLLTEQYQALHVKAGLAGAIQKLNVELGQSVTNGQSLAKIGSVDKLIAILRIPQNSADQININTQVKISTRKGVVAAHIHRIESRVEQGTILAEASIDGQLPNVARPELPVTAKIFIKKEKNVLFINQFPGLSPNNKQDLFVKQSDNTATRNTVEFGELSDGKLMVNSGLQEGQQVICKTLDHLKNINIVSIKN